MKKPAGLYTTSMRLLKNRPRAVIVEKLLCAVILSEAKDLLGV
jgi:hypothetical protein